jgi:DNA-binding beta-propeller fold protein YncE
VQFDTAGNRAFVITQDGVSVIGLGNAIFAGPSIVPPIAVADPAIPPEDLEVNVVATGSFAVVRQANSPKVRVVDMIAQPGLAREITLSSPATDIDLAPDGARAYVVQRAAKKLSIVDVPGDAIDPSGVVTLDLADGTVGSFVLSPDGKRALLFTNATLDERVTMVKLDEPGFPHVTFPLKKAVRAIGISPDSATAIVLNAKAFGDPNQAGSVDEFIDKSFGYTVLDLATGFAKLQITPVDPGPFAFSPDGAKAYVALDGGDADVATRAVQVITTQTGVVITKQLGSPPSAVGILPSAGAAFTAQRHPLGRVSFIDLTTDQVRTVTGFDLNGHVVN